MTPTWTERLANARIEYVIATVIILLIARLILGNYKKPAAKSATEIVESALIAIALVFLVIKPFVVQAFFIPSESMVPTLNIKDYILVNKFAYRFGEPQYGDIVVFKSPPQANHPPDMNACLIVSNYNKNAADKMCLRESNTVIGKVIAPVDKTGDVAINIDSDYLSDFRKLDQICLYKKNSFCDVLFIDKSTEEKGKIIVKLSGIDSSSKAVKLEGAEIRASEKDYIKRLIGKPGDTIQVKDGYLYRNGKRRVEPYLSEPGDIGYNFEPFKVPKGQLFVMGDNRNNSNDSHEWGTLDRNRVLGRAMVRFFPIPRMGLLH